MAGFIEQKQWQSFLDDFSKRNQFRATRLEVMNDLGAQEEESFLPLVGVSYEPKGSDAGDVVIILGGDEQRDLEHVIPQVQQITPLAGTSGEEGIGFEDGDGGKTLLRFEQLPELTDNT